MRHLLAALLLAAAVAAPLPAAAGGIIEFSAGTGYMVSEPKGRTPTTVMVAPGYGLGEVLRLELGILAALGDVEGGTFDMEVRPMLVLDPPLIPVYGRLIAGVNLKEEPRQVVYGGAIGVSASLGGIGIFGEGAYVPRRVEGQTFHLLELRVGVYYAF
ncbi:MAG: hypothetical protein HYZ27_02645 [Deltaproteobacteria bacterium]|nr:hypothetical protein [Deltaproteobacteria bacterium]